MTMSGPTGGSTGTPSFSLPSFWKRREGKFGGRFLAVAAAVVGVVFHKAILGFLISLFANLLITAGLAFLVLMVGYLFINPRSRAAMWGLVQMPANLITSLFYAIGAEGYLKDVLVDRQKKIGEAESRKDRFAGTLKRFDEQMRRKQDEAARERKYASAAQRQQGREGLTKEQQLQLVYAMKLSAVKAGMAKESALTYGQLRERLQVYYDKLVEAIEASKFILAAKTAEWEHLIEQRTAVKDAKSAIDFIKPLYRGDAKSRLADEFATRMLGEMYEDLGQIDSFFQSIDVFLTRINIEKDMYAEDALPEIEKMSSKIDTIVAKVERQRQGLPEPASSLLTSDASQHLTQGGSPGGLRSIADLLGDDPKER